MKIQGSVALVTGANRGLGAAFARGLPAAGAAKVFAAGTPPVSPCRAWCPCGWT